MTTPTATIVAAAEKAAASASATTVEKSTAAEKAAVQVVVLTQQPQKPKQKWADMEDDATNIVVSETQDLAQHITKGAPKYGDRDYRYPDLKRTVREVQHEFLNKRFRPDPTKDELKYAYALTDTERRVGNTVCSRITNGIQVAEDIGINSFVRLRARPAKMVKYVNEHGKEHQESNQIGTTGLTIDYDLWNQDRHSDLKRLDELYKQSKQSQKRSHVGISISEQQYRAVKEDLEKRIVACDRPYHNDHLFANKQLVILTRAFEAAKKGIETNREQLLEPTTMTTVQRDQDGQVTKVDGHIVKVPLVERYVFYSMGIMDQTTFETVGPPQGKNQHPCYQLTIIPDLKKRYSNIAEYVKYLYAMFVESRNVTLTDHKRDRASRTLQELQDAASRNIDYVLKHLVDRRHSLFHRETMLYASFNDMSDAYKMEHGQRVPDRKKHAKRNATYGRGIGRGGSNSSTRAPRGGRTS